MSAARKYIPPDQIRVLRHMLFSDGAWLADDDLEVEYKTLVALEDKGWARLERTLSGGVSCAAMTSLGIAACKWGTAKVLDGGKTDE